MFEKFFKRSICSATYCMSVLQEVEVKFLWVKFYFQYMECVYCGDRFDIELLVAAHNKNWLTQDLDDKWYESIYSWFTNRVVDLIRFKIWIGGKI